MGFTISEKYFNSESLDRMGSDGYTMEPMNDESTSGRRCLAQLLSIRLFPKADHPTYFLSRHRHRALLQPAE